MNDRLKKSVDLVADVSKQLISLSAAIITFVTTIFRQEIHDGTFNAMWAIGFALAAVVAGLVVLLLLTGTIADEDNVQESEISVWDRRIKWPAILQLLCFVAALAMLAAAAY